MKLEHLYKALALAAAESFELSGEGCNAEHMGRKDATRIEEETTRLVTRIAAECLARGEL